MTRWVIKVGSGVLVDDRGELRHDRVSAIARQLVALRLDGYEPVLVSSGAVAAGFRRLGLSEPPQSLRDRQASASVGQIALLRAYDEVFAVASDPERPVVAGLVLLTHDDLRERARFLNGRHTIDRLLECGAIPVINENDTVAVEEILLGDNDRLAAAVAAMIDADRLILLTNVDGLLDQDGNTVAQLSPAELPAAIADMTDARSRLGSGGMRSKLEAASQAIAYGIPTWIANGNRDDILLMLRDGDASAVTAIDPAPRQISARRYWIRFVTAPRGDVLVDDGAVEALVQRRTSLLPRGVVGVQGEFRTGDPVRIVRASDQSTVARGLVEYDAAEISRIAGCHTDEIESVLGYRKTDEIVHRDELVLETVY